MSVKKAATSFALFSDPFETAFSSARLFIIQARPSPEWYSDGLRAFPKSFIEKIYLSSNSNKKGRTYLIQNRFVNFYLQKPLQEHFFQ